MDATETSHSFPRHISEILKTPGEVFDSTLQFRLCTQNLVRDTKILHEDIIMQSVALPADQQTGSRDGISKEFVQAHHTCKKIATACASAKIM